MPGVSAPMTLIRSPMLSQADRVVANADVSFNTELDVVSKLSSAARNARRTHGVVLMVELGDLREGIMPGDLEKTVRETLRFPNIALKGIGTNLACRSGVCARRREHGRAVGSGRFDRRDFRLELDIVSGGNSANLAVGARRRQIRGRINDLRLGEAILLGREPLHRQPIDGLHTDAITLCRRGDRVEGQAVAALGRDRTNGLW